MVRGCVRASAVALVAGAAVVVSPPGAGASTRQTTMAGSVAQVALSSRGADAVAGATPQSIQVWLADDTSGAQAFVNRVSTPGSGSFHRFLSPSAFTRRFGAGATRAAAVRSWLTAQGMSDVTVGPGREYVSANASTATVDRTFATQMRTYAVADGARRRMTIQSNDSPLSIPAALASDVLSVTGLNSTRPTTDSVGGPKRAPGTQCSRYWAQHTVTLHPRFDGLGSAATGICGYSADQLRGAYGQRKVNDGRGVTIALIETGRPTAMARTLADYAHANGLPTPRRGQFREQQLGRSGCENFGNGEEQLDSEAAYAMAPGADQLMVDGNSCQLTGEQSTFDAQLAPLIGDGAHPSASIESASLTIPSDLPPSELATENAILLRAASEGVGMYFATGDSQVVALPASDPNATAVGGTSIGIGAGNRVLFQDGWSDLQARLRHGSWTDEILEGGGGGASPLYDEPTYQEGVVPTSMSDVDGRMARTLPDISADGDGITGMVMGQIDPTRGGRPGPYTTSVEGGTSMATPLVAGMVADAQQGQPRPFGFINPLLYSLSGTRAIADVPPPAATEPQTDRDVFSARSGGAAPVDTVFGDEPPAVVGQVIAAGYDTITGLGTPNGQAFISALRARARQAEAR